VINAEKRKLENQTTRKTKTKSQKKNAAKDLLKINEKSIMFKDIFCIVWENV
jgi:hypothetical protein